MEFKNKELEKFEKKLESQKVAVIGLGVSNIPLIDYLHSKNADVSVFDDREEEKINKEIIEKIKNYKVTNVVEKVTSKTIYEIGDGKINIGLLDFGSKQNIINSLVKRNCKVTVFPANTSSKEILSRNFAGLVLSNGPGDPEDNVTAIQTIKEIYESDFSNPILGICLGHQLMGLATGCKTYKLKYGHRGPNHPVKNIEKDRIFITSQNHGYAIDEKTVNPEIAVVSDINMNDGTVEGLKYLKKDIYTVQFHPEACPGPEDNSYIFDEFIERVINKKENQNAKK